MKKNKDYNIEDEITIVQTLIDKTEIVEDPSILEHENIFDDIIEGNDIPEISRDSFPGLVILRMDSMKMHLFLELKAPINSENRITMKDIRDKIEDISLYAENCVDWIKVKDIYDRVIYEGEIVPETLIAEGKRVKFEIPEHIIIKDTLITNMHPEILESKNVNYHHINPFIFVSKGEFIGDIVPLLPGTNGYNLVGKEIPYPRKMINQYTPGINTFEKTGKLYSTIDGTFKIVANKINICKCLNVSTDIDYHTGDIDFKGDIIIDKSVKKGFNINCQGDIFVKEAIEPCGINCKCNLTVKQGILGDNENEIKVGKKLYAKHTENLTLFCGDDIHIERSTLNSNLSTLGQVLLGKRGTIVGGKINAQNGVISYNIGNKIETTTEISVGLDYEIEEKLKLNQENSQKIVQHMNYLQEKFKTDISREEKDKLKYLFLSLKNRLNSLNNYSRSLLSRLDKNENATILINGTAYPGVSIKICHRIYYVKTNISQVEFYLNKVKGEIEYRKNCNC